ncbi:major facilitator superfamily domain-containing protein [Mariannaea sp. PMI_226]|nr:major facilitator superfamily domain-containing protein [Mariannaea sp. PMI_226]
MERNPEIHSEEAAVPELPDRTSNEVERAVPVNEKSPNGQADRSIESESPQNPPDNDVVATMTRISTTNSRSNLPPPPDGGLTAWTQVAMGWIVLFTTWGYVNSFGAFQTYYTETLPQPASTISWIGSIQTWLTFAIGAFSGRLLDGGFFRHTLFIGAVLQLLGIFLMSISKSYWHLMLTQGVLTGLGGGIFFTPSIGLVATYFNRRRGLALGLATTGNSVGGIVYPLMVRQLLPRVGFAWTARTLGFLNLGCLALAFAFMRPRLPPRKAGALIDWAAFKEPVYVCYVWGLFCFVWAVYYSFYYLGSYAREVLGVSYADASLLITLVNGAGLPARILVPMAADAIGPLNVIALAACSVAITAFTWLSVDSVAGIYIFTAFYGIANGAFQCLMPTGVASITKRLDMVGTRLGMCFTILSIAGLTGPPVGGTIQSASGGKFTGALIWAAVSSTMCAALLIIARTLKAERKLYARC